MAIGKTGNRGVVAQKVRMLNGEKVMPTLYWGKQVGHGNYMAGYTEKGLVLDSTGRPIPYKMIGILE